MFNNISIIIIILLLFKKNKYLCECNIRIKIMEAKVVKVGTSLGLVIPRFIAMEGGFSHGTPINIEFNNNQMIVTRKRKVRAGWAEAIAKYAADGEDELMLPDFIDEEAEELM